MGSDNPSRQVEHHRQGHNAYRVRGRRSISEKSRNLDGSIELPHVDQGEGRIDPKELVALEVQRACHGRSEGISTRDRRIPEPCLLRTPLPNRGPPHPAPDAGTIAIKEMSRSDPSCFWSITTMTTSSCHGHVPNRSQRLMS